jgi:hypothetical protein
MNARRKRPQLHLKVVQRVVIIIIVFEVPSVCVRDYFLVFYSLPELTAGILNESACGDVVSFLY